MANPKTKKVGFFNRAFNYIRDSYNELYYKVTWPSQKELSSSAMLVLVASLVLSAFIFLVDKGLEVVFSNIYRILI